jgi:putrescine aminotransferase
VISGFGRLGRWFGCQRYDFTPDLMTCAKGVSSGYVPLSAVVVGGRVREPFWREDAAPFVHGGTYAAHAGACVAALVNLDILEREGLVERVASLESDFEARIRRLADAPLVGEIRTVGFTAAVPITADALAGDASLPAKVVAAALRHGIATRVLRGHAIHISPAFTITQDEVDTMVDGLRAAFEEVAGSVG